LLILENIEEMSEKLLTLNEFECAYTKSMKGQLFFRDVSGYEVYPKNEYATIGLLKPKSKGTITENDIRREQGKRLRGNFGYGFVVPGSENDAQHPAFVEFTATRKVTIRTNIKSGKHQSSKMWCRRLYYIIML
jgi:hypothetical protein